MEEENSALWSDSASSLCGACYIRAKRCEDCFIMGNWQSIQQSSLATKFPIMMMELIKGVTEIFYMFHLWVD